MALWCNFVLNNNIRQVNTQMASIIIEFYIDLSTSYPNNKLSHMLQRVALEHGLILVDTKYEFGKGHDGSIHLVDEV